MEDLENIIEHLKCLLGWEKCYGCAKAESKSEGGDFECESLDYQKLLFAFECILAKIK